MAAPALHPLLLLSLLKETLNPCDLVSLRLRFVCTSARWVSTGSYCLDEQSAHLGCFLSSRNISIEQLIKSKWNYGLGYHRSSPRLLPEKYTIYIVNIWLDNIIEWGIHRGSTYSLILYFTDERWYGSLIWSLEFLVWSPLCSILKAPPPPQYIFVV